MFSSDRRSGFLWSYAIRSLLAVLALGLFVRLFFLSSLVVSSTGMAPNLIPSDFVLALKGTVLSRGDVIVYSCSQNGQNSCARRLLGLPGDRIEFKQGLLILNGEQAQYENLGSDGFSREAWRDLKYTVQLSSQDMSPVIVPPRHYFVIDDNRGQKESFSGMVSEDSVQGKVWLIWLSLDWYELGEVLKWPKVRWSRVLHSID